jgi:hypothetical protein
MLKACLPRNQIQAFLVHSTVQTVATRFRCPCCGYKTLEAPNALGLCPVCWWEDDGQEDSDASDVRLTVNGQLSLNEARAHYTQCGAAHPRFLRYVRKPYVTEQ